MTRGRRHPVCVAAAIALALPSPAAHAEPQPLACAATAYGVTHYVVPPAEQAYVVDARGLPPALDRDLVLADVQRGFDTWNHATNDCFLGDISPLSFTQGGATEIGASLAHGIRDGVNVVAFRSFAGRWPAPINGAFVYLDAAEDGEIREWDIEFDTDLVWSTSDDVRPEAFDIWNAVAHEVGHLAGLGHVRGSCGPENDPIDEQRTMHPCLRRGQTVKRTLALGDWRGLERTAGRS